MKRFLALVGVVLVTMVSSACECELFDSSCANPAGKLVVSGRVTLRGEPISGVRVELRGQVPDSPYDQSWDMTDSRGTFRVVAVYGACDELNHYLIISGPGGGVTKALGKGCKGRTVNHDFK